MTVLSRRIGHAELPADAVVFRVRPERHPFAPPPEEDEEKEEAARPPRPLLSQAEDSWVRRGGRLVLAVEGSYGPVRTTPAALTLPVRKVFPIWPGVKMLLPGIASRVLVGVLPEDAHAVFASGSSPAVSRLVVGRGEVFLLALPEILENAGVPRGDHLRLLLALAGEGRPVFFDEWALGLGRTEGLLDLMLDWGFGPAFLVGALAFGLWLWRARTRLGPEEADPGESRSEAVDLVDSLAQLYDRALGRREAARLYRHGFERAVGARTGLKGAALARRAEELLGPAAPRLEGIPEIPPSEFLRAVQAVNQGYRRLNEHGHSRRRH